MTERTTDNSRRQSQTPHPLWAAPLCVAVTFLIVGCYTILKHPITSEDGTEGGSEQASHQEFYRGQCLDCHQDYATYPYGFFYGEYPSYYFEYPRWGYYYAYPWWWDHLWYENNGNGTSADGEYLDSTGTGESSRKASRRGSMIPPYVEGAPPMTIPSGSGGYRTDNPSTSGKTGAESGTEGASSGDKPAKIRVKAGDTTGADSTAAKDTKPKPSKKASRRGGTPP